MTALARRCLIATLMAGTGLLPACRLQAAEAGKPPAVGEAASDFRLSTIDGEQVQLSQLLKKGPVVLVVLRGYPGYQCPVCNAQVGQFITSAKKIKVAGANVVLVYPGASDALKQHASDFVRGKTLPDNFCLVLDPDFEFTLGYHLRWEAKNETAYPATFVVDPSGKITFAKISMSHGGRASVDEVLKALGGK